MNDALEVTLRTVGVLAAFLVLPLLVGPDRAQGHGPHAGTPRPDVCRRVPRVGPAGRRRGEVRPEGGHHPGRRRPAGLPVRPCRGPGALPRRARGHPAHAVGRRGRCPRQRPLRPRGDRGRHPRHPDGRLGQRQQVLPARRPCAPRPSCSPTSCRWCSPSRRSASPPAPSRSAASPRRGALVAAVAGCPARWSSSSPRWPSCSGRRSTCRSPTPRSSSAPTPSTPGCGSPSSCCPSTPASSSCRCCSRCSSSAAGRARSPTRSAGCGPCSRGSPSPSLIIWLRVAWPRLREDQLQRLAWLCLVPARPGPAGPHRRLGGGRA